MTIKDSNTYQAADLRCNFKPGITRPLSDYVTTDSIPPYIEDSPASLTYPNIIDIEGIGTVDISKVSYVGPLNTGVNTIGEDVHFLAMAIIDGNQISVCSREVHTALLTAMRGRP